MHRERNGDSYHSPAEGVRQLNERRNNRMITVVREEAHLIYLEAVLLTPPDLKQSLHYVLPLHNPAKARVRLTHRAPLTPRPMVLDIVHR